MCIRDRAQAGPAIRNPSHMKVEYSSDNENWTVLADEDTNFPTGDRVNRFVATASAPVSGRYAVSYTHLDVYKRQKYYLMTDSE